MSQQLNLFAAPPHLAAPTALAPPQLVEGRNWNKHAGPVSVALAIPAAELPELREVVAWYLAVAARLRQGWGMAFTPNLVVEATEPDNAGQVVATVRATHFEGWSPTPESAAWWFRRRVRKEVAHV